MKTQRKADATVRKEIAALDRMFRDPSNSQGIQIQASSMKLALEWSLGRWGMPWSKWLEGCERASKKMKSLERARRRK